jgi:DNA polymerase-3 subunit beta
MNPNEFPEDSFPEDYRELTLSCEQVVSSLRKISYATSEDDVRPALSGVLFSIRDGVLTTVATDGRRMALVERPINGDSSVDGDTVIPMKAVNELVKSLGTEGDLQVYFSENKAIFKTSHTVFSTLLVDGNYPNFRLVIPQAFNFSATIPRLEFIASLERVSLVLSESNLSIKVFFDSTSALLKSSSSEVGVAEDCLGIDFNGEPMEITFNPKFLIGPLKNLDCDNLIIQINDAGSPVAISGDEGFLYIIMPMRN